MPSLAQGLSGLFRRRRHLRRGLFTRSVHLASTFLRPFAPALVTRLRSRPASSALSGLACATMDALTPARRGSLAPLLLSMNSASRTVRISRVARASRRLPFDLQTPDKTSWPPFTARSECHEPLLANARLRLWLAGSPSCLTESSSLALSTGPLARRCSQPRFSATLLLCASCRFTVQQCGTFTRGDTRLHGALAPVFRPGIFVQKNDPAPAGRQTLAGAFASVAPPPGLCPFFMNPPRSEDRG